MWHPKPYTYSDGNDYRCTNGDIDSYSCSFTTASYADSTAGYTDSTASYTNSYRYCYCHRNGYSYSYSHCNCYGSGDSNPITSAGRMCDGASRLAASPRVLVHGNNHDWMPDHHPK